MNKIDDRLVGILGTGRSTSALVQVKSRLHLSSVARRFKVVGYYPFINSVGVECDGDDVVDLSRMPEVDFVYAQGRVTTLGEMSQFVTPKIDKTDYLTLSNGLDGDGVRLCVMDTGISPHVDLCVPRNRICGFTDLLGDRTEPYDDNGHGTFVSGVACGDGLLSGGKIVGIAPKAEVYGLKVIGGSGESGTFKILDGMQWLYDNFARFDVKVVCMSFGADPLDRADPLKIGAEMLVKSGLTVVCAVGNSGFGNLKSPGISDEVIAVGSVGKDNRPTDFSSSGYYHGVYRPDVYANGVNVDGISAYGTYSSMSGTSASAPMVAGVCCLLHQKYRRLTPYQAKSAILRLATSVGGVKVMFPHVTANVNDI